MIVLLMLLEAIMFFIDKNRSNHVLYRQKQKQSCSLSTKTEAIMFFIDKNRSNDVLYRQKHILGKHLSLWAQNVVVWRWWTCSWTFEFVDFQIIHTITKFLNCLKNNSWDPKFVGCPTHFRFFVTSYVQTVGNEHTSANLLLCSLKWVGINSVFTVTILNLKLYGNFWVTRVSLE